MTLRKLSLILGAALAFSLVALTPAYAQSELCPSDNPVIQENNCSGAGSDGWRITNFDDRIAGFAAKSSVNLGTDVALKIGRNGASAPSTVNIDVYRLGYYNNNGGRFIAGASKANVSVNNLFSGCSATDATTGKKSCSAWNTTYTIPGAALPASGEYEARISDPVGGGDNAIFFTVRDDNRAPKADILVAIPTATYEAYNDWGGKSLYLDSVGGPATISGDPRAVKVSFDRPLADPRRNNTFFGPDFYMVQWLEKQGYDVSYTEDVSIHQDPSQLLGHKIDMVTGHSEYWSLEQFNGYLAARNAGVNLASFSANTSFWKVRYEDNGRTLVCYKTVQGSGSTGSGSEGENDWGPDGVKGTADDALGADDKLGGTGVNADHWENSTTTFRDNGAPIGDPNAPDGEGRIGPDMPENELWGVMYYGAELSAGAFPMQIPASDAQQHYSGDRIWRNTGVSKTATTTIGTNLVGWEWDAIPTQSQYLTKQPPNVIPLTNTTFAANSNINWLQDEGRAYATTPPPGQPSASQAVKYTWQPSGAMVFSAGTNDWANALAPNPDTRIMQATYNILSDEGVQPGTPSSDIKLDPPSGPQPPTASFTISPNPAQTGQTVTFDGSGSSDPDGPIAKYEWDLDGDGTYETDSGSNPVVTKTYSTNGVYTVRLRVTDGQGVRSTANRALSVDNTGGGSYASRVLGTTGLLDYWRMGDTTGTTLTDSVGSSNATTSGAPTLGAPGALFNDPDPAVTFDGVDDAASANVDLSGTNQLTVEFWMRWSGFANDDRLAMEFTPNFNNHAGGFIIDPNEAGGKFAVSIGDVGTRNNVVFDRPSAGKWHHYAFVLDASAPAATQIIPYVDGQPVTYTKLASNTGAGNFASSQLYFMSRAGTSLFGRGDLDEVSIFNRALPAATIAAHYAGNPQPPVASFTSSVDPASVGQLVTFDGSASTSPNGSIAKYEWDLDGDGTFETDTGSTPTATHTYSATGNVDVKLRVTDSAGKTATSTVTIAVEQPGSGTYSDRVRNTAGLTHYWRMGELTGTTLADSRGSSTATITGGPSLGAPGAVTGDSNTSVSFNGTTSAATANVDLSATSRLTIEFWLKWDTYANDDRLAMEFTSNFNSNPGGFLVDPNESGGKFAVSIGDFSSRNSVSFTRPSAGQWHHYAFVIDTSAVAATQIIPYVDGQAVAYTKLASGTGAGNFANSQLYFMSRAASSLFGAGDLDEVALYSRALPASTIAGHFGGNLQLPTASFAATPNPAESGQTVTFDGSGSSDPDGSIAKYEWDLDGNGTYETDTGTTPTTTHTYSTAGDVDVKLRVTDNTGNTDTVTHTLSVEAPGSGAYASRIQSTAGLTNYWRMGNASGTTLSDSKGNAPASILGTPTLGAPGALQSDTDTAVSFNGSGDAASADLNLSGTNKLTVEFWMKWDAYADDDRLAFEFTPNFNQNPGGFLVDPNAGGTGSKFAVSLGQGDARNSVAFDRPSAGEWHYYAFVMDTSASADNQIIPYVDGDPVAFTKLASGTGAGNFANSQLYFMSRGGNSLFGAGDLDEVAIYNRALSAATVSDHYGGPGGGSGAAPVAAFTFSPSSPQSGQAVTFDASGSSDPDGTIAKYQWDLDGNGTYETDTGTTPTATKTYSTSGNVDVKLRVTDNSGTTNSVTHTVTVPNRAPTASFTYAPNPAPVGQAVTFDASASSDPDGSIAKYEWDLDGNGTFETDTGTTPTATHTYSAANVAQVSVRVTDDKGATDSQTHTLTFSNQPPTASFSASPSSPQTGQTVTFDASASSDPDGSIAKYEWDLDGNGTFETDTGTTPTATHSYSTTGEATVGLRVTDNSGATATQTKTVTVANPNQAPTASFIVSPSPAATRQTVTLNGSASSDPDGSIAKYEWDLDGNGTFETDGGAAATQTNVFSTVGAATIGLRVTDNSGATGTTTRSLTVNSAYRAAILGTAGISDYWRLDDTGNTAADSNGANNNGTYTNGPVAGAGLIAGETNDARTFDGTNDYVELSPTPFGTPSQLSAETWVRTSATKAAGGYHFLVTDSSAEISGSSLSLDNGFALAIDSSNHAVFSVARNVIFTTQRATATSSVTLAPNTIHHVVGTYDGTTARIYVDGVQVGTATLNGGVSWSGSRDLRLGRPVESSASQFFLQGTMDETAVYNQALPAATVLAHYNAGKS